MNIADLQAQGARLQAEGRLKEAEAVLRAAAEAGITVPKLCATDSLKAFGSCRLCLVEVDGMKVVVDRGWIPNSPQGATVRPEVPAPPAGEVTVPMPRGADRLLAQHAEQLPAAGEQHRPAKDAVARPGRGGRDLRLRGAEHADPRGLGATGEAVALCPTYGDVARPGAEKVKR